MLIVVRQLTDHRPSVDGLSPRMAPNRTSRTTPAAQVAEFLTEGPVVDECRRTGSRIGSNGLSSGMSQVSPLAVFRVMVPNLFYYYCSCLEH